MTRFALVSATAGSQPRAHRPTGHLLTVVGTRRLRDGLNRRYWIRCRLCDLNLGPYTDWQTAWLDAWQPRIATSCTPEGRAGS